MLLVRIAAFSLVVGLLSYAFPSLGEPRDFVEYYSAAEVLADGGDPYDGAQLLPVQREVTGNPELSKAVSLWTPPWTLPIYLPFGFLPFPIARWLWLYSQIAVFALSIELLWKVYSGPRRFGLLIPYALLLGFAPFFWNRYFGQNTAFLLLGLAGFLHFRERGSMRLAGVCAALTAIKPHMLALFGIALLLEALTRSGRRTLAAGVASLVVSSAISIAFNPQIFVKFVEAIQRPSTPETVRLADWHVPLLSYEFRHALAPDNFSLQFLPVLAALLLTITWQWRYPSEWPTKLPWLVLGSALVAPYGGWMFDLTVLFVPAVVAMLRILAIRQLLPIITAVLSLGLLSLFGFLIRGLEEPIWFTPLFAFWFAGILLWVHLLKKGDLVSPTRERGSRFGRRCGL